MTTPTHSVHLLVSYNEDVEDNPGTWDWASLIGGEFEHMHPIEVLEDVREFVIEQGLSEGAIDESNTEALEYISNLKQARYHLDSAHHFMQEAGLIP